MEIKLIETKNPKKIPEKVSDFGKIFTDHMFVMDYTEGQGWHDPVIMPYEDLLFSPAANAFHYGQGIFEGLKAYKNDDGQVRLFRPEANFQRLNRSAQKVCMPEVDVDFALKALEQLVKLEKNWIPTAPNTALYIRPFMIATEAYLGVRAAKNYKFMIILSPVGSYYASGLDSVDIMVEENYVRAVKGGLGEAKTMANYAASLLAGEEAQRKGFSQVLWLDGVERKYIEEVGTMNIMFKIDGKIITPPLTGTILPGITRDSVLTILKDWGLPVEEYRLSIDEVLDSYKSGKLEEVFGTGTAAVISPVGRLVYGDQEITIGNYDDESVVMKLFKEVTDIQTGKMEDRFGWVKIID